MGDIISPEFPVNTEDVKESISIHKGLLSIDTSKTLPFGLSIKVNKDIYLSIVGRENQCYIAEISKEDETISSKKCKSLFEAFIFALQTYNNRSPR